MSIDFGSSTLEHVLRFSTHLILFLRSMELIQPSEHIEYIIKRYTSLLKQSGKGNLIPIYLELLPHGMQVDCYSDFLQEIEQDKEQFIRLGFDHALDMPTIIERTVNGIFSRGGILVNYLYDRIMKWIMFPLF